MELLLIKAYNKIQESLHQKSFQQYCKVLQYFEILQYLLHDFEKFAINIAILLRFCNTYYNTFEILQSLLQYFDTLQYL